MLSPEVINEKHVVFQAELVQLIKDLDVGPDRVWNKDQIGMLYNKLPNTIIRDKSKAKSTRGYKLMKSKDRITIMAYVSASYDKIYTSIISK